MPFSRRNNRQFLRPINSIKHVIDVQTGSALATKSDVPLIKCVINPDLTTDTSVVEAGCRINSIYLNVQIIGTDDSALSNIYMILYKNPQGDIPTASIPNANSQGASEFRRQIFHSEMRMMASNAAAIPITMFNGVIRIPKVFRTMRQGDIIELQFFTPGTTSEICVQCIYKEIR